MNAECSDSSFRIPRSQLLGFLMISVLAATATELAELKPIRRGLFILGRYVVAALANITLKNNVIARHLAISDFRLPNSTGNPFVSNLNTDFRSL